MHTRPENSIYVRGLTWAYERQLQGFKKEDLKIALQLTEEEWDCAEWLFFNGIGGDSPLIWTPQTEFLRHGQAWGQIWYLSPTGMAAAVDYLELKEAQKSGRQAFWLAIAAIAITAIVGVVQVYFDVTSIQAQSKTLPIHEHGWKG